MPKGVDADALRKTILQRFDLSLGAALGKIKGRTFRIGHLGYSNDLTLLATMAGCEMGLKLAGVRLAAGRGSIHGLFREPPGPPRARCRRLDAARVVALLPFLERSRT